jgi:hypothetical protein
MVGWNSGWVRSQGWLKLESRSPPCGRRQREVKPRAKLWLADEGIGILRRWKVAKYEGMKVWAWSGW